MPENAIIPDGVIPNKESVQETAKKKFERERLSRRQALKKLGMTSAMATFALFSVDDLARMVGKAMQQRAGDNKVAEQIATEFQQAGIAMAQPPGSQPLGGPCGGNAASVQSRGPCCTGSAVGAYCGQYNNDVDCEACINGVYSSDGYCSGYNQANNSQKGTANYYCPAMPA